MARFQEHDLLAVHAFASDPLVCRYATWGPNKLADSQAFLADALLPRGNCYLVAVLLGETLIGSASVWACDGKPGLGEIGYTLQRASWGRGYGTETAELLLQLGFEQLELERLTATCDPDNAASMRVLEKAGLHRVGSRPEPAGPTGGRTESLVFTIQRTEYRA